MTDAVKFWLCLFAVLILGGGIGYLVGNHYVKTEIVTIQSDTVHTPPSVVIVKGKPDSTSYKNLALENADLKWFIDEMEQPEQVKFCDAETSMSIPITGTIEQDGESYVYTTEAEVGTKVRFIGEPYNDFKIYAPTVKAFTLKIQSKRDIALPFFPIFGFDVLAAYHQSFGVGGLVRIDKLGLGAILFVSETPTMIGSYSVFNSDAVKFDALIAYKGAGGLGGMARVDRFGIGVVAIHGDTKTFMLDYSL